MNNNSIIDKYSSNAMKGFVMFLIILGHNMLLAQYTDSSGVHYYTWFHVIYKCHVFAFFVLPFLYGCKLTDEKDVKKALQKDCIRLYLPYVWFSLFCVIQDMVLNQHLDLKLVARAFVVGSAWLWEDAVGCTFLWFLPAMAIFLLWRNLWFVKFSIYVKIAVTLLSFVVIFFRTNILTILDCIPFFIGYSFIYLWPAICCRYIIERVKNVNPWICFTLFAILVVGYANKRYLLGCITAIMEAFLPVVFFLFIYSCGNWISRIKLFQLMGSYSFHIYLMHLFVYGGLAMIGKYFFVVCNQYVLGGLILILTIAISLLISMAICTRFPKINKYVFGIKIV